MSDRRSLVIIKGEVKNNVSDYDDSSLYTVDVYFENGKKYTYKKDNVQILTDPVKVDPDDLKFVTAAGKELDHIQHAECYSGNFVRYYKFYFLGGRCEVYSSKELKIYENAASTPAARNLLDYYKLISKKIGLHANDGTNILYNQLNKISFVDKNTVLARYIEPQKIYVKSPKDTVIFPFGCNSSQMTAVNNAVANKIKEWHPDMEVKIASAQGLADCKKLLMLAKAGKYNGYLLEGMGCPGGCIGGGGAHCRPPKSRNMVLISLQLSLEAAATKLIS